MNYIELIQLANEAKLKAYAPYSHFRVGAALLSESGEIYTGVNVENASYGLTNCAERTAVFKAVSEGETKFKTIAITSDSDDFISPCGACRQVLIEICGKNLEVILTNKNNEIRILTMEELLPFSFNKESLTK
ncbi:MAG: cytidine deaminase [Ignavibacteriales bacterium]|jgi:cytidine deaminase|nr:cytidine deaminase [Ignavibacteriales bacterium]MBK7979724.1 cytidine deaminase [Ignavibacteriota bacterium]